MSEVLSRVGVMVAIARDPKQDDEMRHCAWCFAASRLLDAALEPGGVRWRIDRAVEMRAQALDAVLSGHMHEAIGTANEARALYEQAVVALLRLLLGPDGPAPTVEA